MATPAEEVLKRIAELRGRIKQIRLITEAKGELDAVVVRVESDLNEVDERSRQAGADPTAISADLSAVEKMLSFLAEKQPRGGGSKLERLLGFLGRSASAFGIIALALAFLFTIVAVGYTLAAMGASSWQTIPGGRAVLLLSLTFAFVTFGGALIITPLFSEGSIDERFRRAREVFLLFAGMFSTVVGFYFAAATGAPPGAPLFVESFDARRGELQVSVTGAKPPFSVEVEYGPKDAVQKKTPQTLDAPGTLTFAFTKEDWPLPITIRVRDAVDARAERQLKPERNELVGAGYKEPRPQDQKKDAKDTAKDEKKDQKKTDEKKDEGKK